MPSFFSAKATKKSQKQTVAVFAGLDDPFNFPSSKMRYNSRSGSPTSSQDSATDSGYGSIDDDSPLSPKAEVSSKRRQLRKDSKGHWRTQSYEYQSEDNDHKAEILPILHMRDPDNMHEWKPDPKRTFTDIETRSKPKWYTSRVYGKALAGKEKSEGVTDLQRSMAPVIRRASPSPSPSLSRPSAGPRKKSTLLHPSPPTSTPTSIIPTRASRDSSPFRRGRKPSTLLHPSVPWSPALRSPRHRSPTPLGIPTSSERQPTPTPLRIHLRKPSVLHSCFSDSESDFTTEDGEDEEGPDDASSFSSIETAAGDKNGVILARTALVARAVRVRVESPGLKQGC